MQLNVNLEIPETHLCDLLTTAWEGGSDYWTPSYDAHATRRGGDQDSDLRHLDVVLITYDTPEGDEENNEEVIRSSVGPDQIGEAISKVLNGTVKVGDHILKDIQNNIEEVGGCDADTADVLLQVATFGEIIYG